MALFTCHLTSPKWNLFILAHKMKDRGMEDTLSGLWGLSRYFGRAESLHGDVISHFITENSILFLFMTDWLDFYLW